MTLELAPTPTATLIEGGVGCGKTAALVARASELLEGGAAPEDILVLAATPDAARALDARLAEAVGERAGAIEVACARDVALGLLASEEGRAFSGRAGRLVTPVELGFILEDMKVGGLKQRRLREMLKFFYRNETELAGGADDDDGWLIPGEEGDTHALLRAVLHFTGGILEPEASAMAVRFLLASPEALAGAQRPHVLVDDYQMYSRASQHLANLIARDSITVAADPTAVAEVFESYPYGEGVGEFTQANEGCERIVLATSRACPAAARAASRLRTALDAGAAALGDGAAPVALAAPSAPDRAAAASFTALEAADPAAEMDAVADAVQAALEAGADPSSVYVLAFHPAWERRVARAQGLEGDELIGALADALDLPAEERERTMQLVGVLTAPAPDSEGAAAPAFPDGAIAAPGDAPALIARARRRMNAPVFENAEGRVRVGDGAHLTGLTPATLVLCGFVNGFFPPRDYFDATVTTPDRQKLVRTADTRRLYAAVGKPTERLAASWFTATGLVEAETLKLDITRVRLRRGEGIATTASSIYLAEIDPAAEPSAPEFPGDPQASGDAAAVTSS